MLFRVRFVPLQIAENEYNEIGKNKERKCLTVDIGKKIADLRTLHNMSQQTLADLLFVSRELVSKWENGIRRPEYRMIGKIAGIFNVPVDAVADKNDLIFKELSDCIPPDSSVSDEKLAEAVNAFLHKIPEKEANIFLNRYYFMKTAAEIASAYGIGENHVRSILSKTRVKLTKFIKEDRR